MKLTGLKADKKKLRYLMKQRVAEVSQNSIVNQSSLIFNIITRITAYQNAKRIGVYLSMPSSEVQTDSIVLDALESGKQVFVPYIDENVNKKLSDSQKSNMEMVKIDSLVDYKSLKPDKWGIPVIDHNTFSQRETILQNSSKICEGLDIILLPGVAFEVDPITKYIKRLGHGKGYFDSFLHQYKAKFYPEYEGSSLPGVPLYGLSLSEQLLSDNDKIKIPIEPHDFLLHGLVVGNGNFYKT